eukprot:1395048-Amphidinium_carterae.1
MQVFVVKNLYSLIKSPDGNIILSTLNYNDAFCQSSRQSEREVVLECNAVVAELIKQDSKFAEVPNYLHCNYNGQVQLQLPSLITITSFTSLKSQL